MRDKNGIEIKCANCHYQSKNFGQCLAALVHPKCENGSLFEPQRIVIEARIRELQGMVMQAAMLAEKVPQLEKRIAKLQNELNVLRESEKVEAQEADRLRAEIEAYKAKIAELEEANKDLSEGMNIGYWLGRHDGRRAETGTKEWNMRDKIKLNQCPFCGGEAEAYLGDDWYVECKSCLANTTHYSVESEAIAAWNQRVDHISQSVKMVEPIFTREEIEAIKRMFSERYPRARELPEIDQCIIAKCDALLKGGGNDIER